MYNPTKAPSQLTSGIPSRPTRGHGWTRDSWRYCEDAQKSLSEAYMFLLKKKITTITLILILTLGGKV